jgi:hypothetical protein
MLPASMLGDYSTSVSSTPSYFLRRTDRLGNPFLNTSLLDLHFLLFFFFGSSYRPSCLLLTVKIRQPSHEFTFGVGISFIPYPLVVTPVV